MAKTEQVKVESGDIDVEDQQLREKVGGRCGSTERCHGCRCGVEVSVHTFCRFVS